MADLRVWVIDRPVIAGVLLLAICLPGLREPSRLFWSRLRRVEHR